LPTGVVTCLVTPDAERTMCAFAGASLELAPDDLRREQFAGARFVHLTGYLVQMHDGAVLRRAAQLARAVGARVSFDPASTPLVESRRDFFQAFVCRDVDLLFANQEEAAALLGAGHTPSALHDWAELVVKKRGPDGATIAHRGEVIDIPAEPARAVDTTGAGDLFAAGFLWGLLHERPLSTCGRLGTHLAAAVTQVYGAHFPADVWPGLLDQLRHVLSKAGKETA